MKILGIALVVVGLFFLGWTGLILHHSVRSDLPTALVGFLIGTIFLCAGIEATIEGVGLVKASRFDVPEEKDEGIS